MYGVSKINIEPSLMMISVQDVEFKGNSALFENDIYDAIDLVKCCEGRTSYGGPSEASVNNQIALANAQLDAWEEKNA